MSLREEISLYFSDYFSMSGDAAEGTITNCNNIADDIIAKVEKRIDKEIQSLYKPSIRNNPMVIQKRDFLREFKKEMLK